MHRNGQEWTSITGTDLKIHPKIHVLSVLDENFWLSNVKYQISLVYRQFQLQKTFSKIFCLTLIFSYLTYAYLHQSPIKCECMQ